MIADARARKENRSVNKCDKCEFNTASITMLKRHKSTNHKEDEIQIVDNRVENLTEEKKQTNVKTYISKRIQCDNCDKKFNKESTFKKHMDTAQVGMDPVSMNSNKEGLSSNKNNTSESNEMTFQYHLRKNRVPQKQHQMSKSPSV